MMTHALLSAAHRNDIQSYSWVYNDNEVFPRDLKFTEQQKYGRHEEKLCSFVLP